MGRQQQLTLSIVVALVALWMVLVFKPYVCRFRNGHEPDAEGVREFLDSDRETLQTKCVTCKCDLELRTDPEDPNLYWIVEI